jgi:hypothetical protein
MIEQGILRKIRYVYTYSLYQYKERWWHVQFWNVTKNVKKKKGESVYKWIYEQTIVLSVW